MASAHGPVASRDWCFSQREFLMASYEPDHPPTYDLPADDMPVEVRRLLHPWIEEFVGLSPRAATKRLHERWSAIARPSLLSLRETLSEFEVRSIVIREPGGMIHAVRPGSDVGCVGNSFYLPAPLERGELLSRAASVSLADDNAFIDFMTHFAGMREDSYMSGDFVYSETPWDRFTDSWEGSIEGFGAWEGSLTFYVARNGCCLLVRPDGKVGWWFFQERRVATQADNIDEFVMQFSEHRKLAWPYDPYGPPDD
jgi:hypothetical protein